MHADGDDTVVDDGHECLVGGVGGRDILGHNACGRGTLGLVAVAARGLIGVRRLVADAVSDGVFERAVDEAAAATSVAVNLGAVDDLLRGQRGELALSDVSGRLEARHGRERVACGASRHVTDGVQSTDETPILDRTGRVVLEVTSGGGGVGEIGRESVGGADGGADALGHQTRALALRRISVDIRVHLSEGNDIALREVKPRNIAKRGRQRLGRAFGGGIGVVLAEARTRERLVEAVHLRELGGGEIREGVDAESVRGAGNAAVVRDNARKVSLKGVEAGQNLGRRVGLAVGGDKAGEEELKLLVRHGRGRGRGGNGVNAHEGDSDKECGNELHSQNH